ncbi:hypothetical protein P152DRAFT_193610 [Eremomyces bilateralis CBS 781.70]|uniref:Zn(2)-C6 fungal-type domain-containing protein n=1 Tax=Eremomyces bilateralis CBS 781.70 TaxID=1392243 RepID=A0A6G1GCS0_9PEZI|nr:uncharacterized protein P152DRAFT_193610 [Eremomyces bilateralis CBS 781.70]KAF1815706.1 hypothetical protein P152DRAFT_193610 [Eremomyces bilateralis CBS 781.70]
MDSNAVEGRKQTDLGLTPQPNMTGIADFTNIFRAYPNPNTARKVIKRPRQAFSCTACRTRKLKCDRERPCGICIARGDDEKCRYASTPKQQKESRLGVQGQLQRLEEMVSKLVQDGSAVANSNTAITPDDSTSSSNMSTNGTQLTLDSEGRGSAEPGPRSVYTGATHWTTVLDGIRDIQDWLDFEPEPIPSAPNPPSSGGLYGFIFGDLEPLKVEEAIEAIPPRSVTDPLLQLYFSSKFASPTFLHEGKFHRDYERFRTDPARTSLFWISLLYSALSIAALAAHGSRHYLTKQSYNIDPAALRKKAGQCLVTAEYHEAQQYTIESLVLYCLAGFYATSEADSSLWSLFGLVTRQAQRMGYHRDPSHLKSNDITPFEAEMRRRVWFYLETFDVLFSFHLGLPPIIHEGVCDTTPPSHLLDEDFDEHSEVLPEPRSDVEPTHMLYQYYKSAYMRAFRKVVRHALAAGKPSFEETILLTNEMEDFHNGLAESLKIRPLQVTHFTDPPSTIMHRLMLEMCYLKSMCVLHRTYLNFEKRNPKYDRSREICRAAAIRILELQSEYHRESQPGGRLHESSWMMSSLNHDDFLLGAMIVCLDLRENESMSVTDRARKIEALEISHDIWSERKDRSMDVQHALKVLGLILKSVKGHENWHLGMQDSEVAVMASSALLAGSSMQFESLLMPGTVQCDMEDLSLALIDSEGFDELLNDSANIDWVS